MRPEHRSAGPESAAAASSESPPSPPPPWQCVLRSSPANADDSEQSEQPREHAAALIEPRLSRPPSLSCPSIRDDRAPLARSMSEHRERISATRQISRTDSIDSNSTTQPQCAANQLMEQRTGRRTDTALLQSAAEGATRRLTAGSIERRVKRLSSPTQIWLSQISPQLQLKSASPQAWDRDKALHELHHLPRLLRRQLSPRRLPLNRPQRSQHGCSRADSRPSGKQECGQVRP